MFDEGDGGEERGALKWGRRGERETENGKRKTESGERAAFIKKPQRGGTFVEEEPRS